jgi:hypothetical protein
MAAHEDDVFVSYSRVDGDFVRQLQDGLTARDRNVWVDWQDIPPTAEWMTEIQEAIDACNACIIVLSPDFLASQVCSTELQRAIGSNKRIVPVLLREVEVTRVPEAVAKLNWIRCTEGRCPRGGGRRGGGSHPDRSGAGQRPNTQLLVRSRRWETKGEDAALLLRGSEPPCSVAHQEGVYPIAFGPDGTQLAAGGWYGEVRFWDTTGWHTLGPPIVAGKVDVMALAYSPDGSLLASGGFDEV